LQTGFSLACAVGKLDAMKALVQSGWIDVNQDDNEGNTPLMLAAEAGKEQRMAPVLQMTIRNRPYLSTVAATFTIFSGVTSGLSQTGGQNLADGGHWPPYGAH